MRRGAGGEGFSLPEILLALAVIGLALTAAAPALAQALARARVGAAAREMAGEMARLRARAIASGRRVGLRFVRAEGRYGWTVYEDGDGDGVHADDIARGRDGRIDGPRDLASRYEGVDFGLLDLALPDVPPGTGVLAPGSDPIRFGRSGIVTFTPLGTSSSGTLFVSDGRRMVVAVVVYGSTGRIRVWRFERASWRWVR